MSTVALVDDDPGVLRAVGTLFATKGFTVHSFASAAEFLASAPVGGCVVSDLRMPGLNGLDLLAALKAANDPRPVVLLTAHGDVELAVRALKQGAFDFIEKPFEEDRLLDAVVAAIAEGERSAVRMTELSDLRVRYDTLSERQREVMWLVVAGCANKEIAVRLGISIRTVETYRAWVFEKLNARTLADLVRLGLALEEVLDADRDGRGTV